MVTPNDPPTEYGIGYTRGFQDGSRAQFTRKDWDNLVDWMTIQLNGEDPEPSIDLFSAGPVRDAATAFESALSKSKQSKKYERTVSKLSNHAGLLCDMVYQIP